MRVELTFRRFLGASATEDALVPVPSEYAVTEIISGKELMGTHFNKIAGPLNLVNHLEKC